VRRHRRQTERAAVAGTSLYARRALEGAAGQAVSHNSGSEQNFSTFAGVETLVPLLHSQEPGDLRSTVDLISETVQLGVAYKLVKSATIVYELRLVHDPQLIEAVQIQNNAGFKATFNLL
jgi:hypothetical protein